MKPSLAIKFYLFISILSFSFLSCSKSESDDKSDPSNLVVNITVSDTDEFTILVTAQADNVTEFQLFIDDDAEPVSTNANGSFEYTFNSEGFHTVTIKAFGTSGKYIKNDSQILIGSGEVPIGEGYSTPMEYDGMQLVWNDEFIGSTVDASNWTFETGAGGWGNNEWQYYRPDNAWVEGGTLTIEARKEAWQQSNYTSARMVTRNKRSFQYGRIDIRALLPEGQGIWPALWMLGNNLGNVGWPACGELDIMEMIGGSGREKTVYGTMHYDDNGHKQAGGQYTLPSGTFADEYHVFTVIWDANYIKWYVNDNLFKTLDIRPAYLTEFHQPGFFIFNIAVGGNWPGYPNATTHFPQQMKVDYIRVFQ
ncbi:MAG TPA: glycoside hydrolase family 16 protein [Lentimicrobium sp.]|nr:glycoside hydrolase family 16 protein [Lentimicrobium sp.]